MKKTFFAAVGVVIASSAFAQTTNFTAGNLVVSAVDITVAGSGVTGPVSLKEFNLTPSSSPVSTVAFPSSGVGRFVYPWNTNSGLNLNFNAGFFTIAGYDADSGVASVSSSSSAAIARLIAKIPVSGTISFVSNNNLNNLNTPRSVVTDGTNFWSAGSGTAAQSGGIQYVLASGTNSAVSLAPDTFNVRHIGIYNGDLYYTTASANLHGLHKYTGLPTSAVNSTYIAAMSTVAPVASPYDFVFTDANTVYISDDRTLANGGGIHKFTFNGSVWSLAYVISTALPTGCRGITHLGGNDFAVITNETVSGTTATTPSRIYRVTDGGSDALSTSTLLQTAPNTTNYRGIRYIPGAANQNLTGTLNLSDTAGAFAFNRSIGYTVKQGTATIGSGTVVASASASAFSITLPNSATGAATIVWDGSSFLARNTNFNLTGSDAAIGSVTMQNGDVDNSGEVDAVDIDEVIASFGLTTDINADVDVSGEVDAVDIDIVIANFGGVND